MVVTPAALAAHRRDTRAAVCHYRPANAQLLQPITNRQSKSQTLRRNHSAPLSRSPPHVGISSLPCGRAGRYRAPPPADNAHDVGLRADAEHLYSAFAHVVCITIPYRVGNTNRCGGYRHGLLVKIGSRSPRHRTLAVTAARLAWMPTAFEARSGVSRPACSCMFERPTWRRAWKWREGICEVWGF
jgi:hypothetical protein